MALEERGGIFRVNSKIRLEGEAIAAYAACMAHTPRIRNVRTIPKRDILFMLGPATGDYAFII